MARLYALLVCVSSLLLPGCAGGEIEVDRRDRDAGGMDATSPDPRPDAGFDAGPDAGAAGDGAAADAPAVEDPLCSLGGGRGHRTLLIVVDGLRPDYITPELMPNLHALGERGVFGDAHTAAYPTYTRANSPTVSTGSYPSRHGVVHNHMYLPEVDSEPFSTGSARNLRRLDEATDGQLLTVPSLGELLEPDHRLFVTGSGGSGTSFLQNHRGTGVGIWTAGGVFVPSDGRDEAVAALGEPPSDNAERTVWAFDAYLYHALGDNPPDVTTIWINEPDSAGHSYGVGAPGTLEAVANVDAQIGRVVRAHEDNELTDRVNILVSTDHGFSTCTGGFSVSRTLDAARLTDGAEIVRNMVYLQRDDPELMVNIVEALQRDPAVGNIYTRPIRPGEGAVPGTLSTEVIRWDHERSADIIASPVWSDDVNAHGYAGTTSCGSTATHGSDSPFDLQIRLLAAGPDIKTGLRSTVPTGNVDLVPTILHLLGLEPPAMDGRVMCELLRGGPAPEEVHVHELTHRASTTLSGGPRYRAELDTLQVGSTVYVRGARTYRD